MSGGRRGWRGEEAGMRQGEGGGVEEEEERERSEQHVASTTTSPYRTSRKF